MGGRAQQGSSDTSLGDAIGWWCQRKMYSVAVLLARRHAHLHLLLLLLHLPRTTPPVNPRNPTQGGINQDVGNNWLLPAEMADGRVPTTASELVDQLGIKPKAMILCVDMEPRTVMDTIDCDLLMNTTETLKLSRGSRRCRCGRWCNE